MLTLQQIVLHKSRIAPITYLVLLVLGCIHQQNRRICLTIICIRHRMILARGNTTSIQPSETIICVKPRPNFSPGLYACGQKQTKIGVPFLLVRCRTSRV